MSSIHSLIALANTEKEILSALEEKIKSIRTKMAEQLAHGDPVEAVRGYRSRQIESLKDFYSEKVALSKALAESNRNDRISEWRALVEKQRTERQSKGFLDYRHEALAAYTDEELCAAANIKDQPTPCLDPADYDLIGAELSRRGMKSDRDMLRAMVKTKRFNEPYAYDEEYLAAETDIARLNSIDPARGIYFHGDPTKPLAAICVKWNELIDLTIDTETRTMREGV